MELLLKISPPEIKTIVGSIICLIAIIGILLNEIKVFLIRINSESGELKVIYYLLFREFQKNNNSPNFIFKSFFKGDIRLPRNVKLEDNPGIKFWEEVYNKHPKNLTICLNRKKLNSNDINYFDYLLAFVCY